MALLIINVFISFVLGVMLFNSYISSKRGTNVVTRFVRDVKSNGSYNLVIAVSMLITLLIGTVGIFFKCPYAAVPSALVTVLGFVFKIQSTNSEQRVVDARVVTKGAGQAAKNAAVPVAATAAAVVAAPAMIGAAGGVAAGTVGASTALGTVASATAASAATAVTAGTVAAAVGDMSDAMEDVSSPDFKEVDGGITEALRQALYRKAEMMGFHVETYSLDQIATQIVEYAPAASIEELPENWTDVQKAVKLLGIKEDVDELNTSESTPS